ncbi:MAG: rod shape-determining protein MreC [Sphingomonadales bacterium]|jgi:rod shape-determining protein MreC
MVFLIRLIRKNLFLVVYLLLMVLSIGQVVRFNIYQQSYYFNTSSAFVNGMSRMKTGIADYFKLADVNAALAEENRVLREKLKENNQLTDSQLIVSKDSFGKKKYTYQTANVVQFTTHLQNNFITIDKGSKLGIKKDMAVLSPSGIAGIVVDVSEDFSLVLSAINSQFKATPMIPSANFRDGSVSWNGKDPTIIQLNGVSRFEKITPGMSVVTSNYSVKFPSGIPIGTILRVNKTGGSSFYDIDVKLATDFRKLSHVYVVNYSHAAQIDTLNRRTNNGR